MGRKKLADVEVIGQLAKESRGGVKDWKLVMKLTAIIAYGRSSGASVAEAFGVSVETISRWYSKFASGGVEGLMEKPRGHKKKLLDAELMEEVKGWVVSGCDESGKSIHWTLKGLCLAIKGVRGVDIKHTAMADSLHRAGLSLRRPRPSNCKADKEKADEFKKKQPRRQRRSKRKTQTAS